MAFHRAFPTWKMHRQSALGRLWGVCMTIYRAFPTGKMYRQSAPGRLRSVCKSIYRAFPPWKPASPQDHPSPEAPSRQPPPSKDPAEGFVDFFFGLVGVDVEVGFAGQHC